MWAESAQYENKTSGTQLHAQRQGILSREVKRWVLRADLNDVIAEEQLVRGEKSTPVCC